MNQYFLCYLSFLILSSQKSHFIRTTTQVENSEGARQCGYCVQHTASWCTQFGFVFYKIINFFFPAGHQNHSKTAGTENGNSANAQGPPDHLTNCKHHYENDHVWKLDGSLLLKTHRIFQSSKLFQSRILPRSHGLSLSEMNAEFDPIESLG